MALSKDVIFQGASEVSSQPEKADYKKGKTMVMRRAKLFSEEWRQPQFASKMAECSVYIGGEFAPSDTIEKVVMLFLSFYTV